MKNSGYRDIWENTYPVLFALLLEPAVSLVDSFVASRIGLLQLAGIGVGESIYAVLVWVFIFLAYGTTPLVSSLRAKEDYTNLIQLINYGRRLVFIFGFSSFVIIYFFSDYFISLFNPILEVGEYADDYIIPRSFGIVFYLYIMHSTAVLRGLRRASVALKTALIASFINVFLDFVFVFVFNMGVFGIGLASAISFVITSVYVHFLLRKEVLLFGSSKNSDPVDIQKSFFSITSSILIRSFFLMGMMTLMKNLASRVSYEAIALHHVLNHIWNLFSMLIDSVAIASQTLVAEKIANGGFYWKSKLSKQLLTICVFIAISLYVISVFFIDDLVVILSNTEKLNSTVNNLRFVFAATLLIGCFAFLWDGILLGLGSFRHFSIITIAGSIAGAGLMLYSYNKFSSLYSLWFCLLISLCIRTLLGFYYQRKK